MTYPYCWVDEQAQFDRVFQQLVEEKWVVIDTEFVRTNTFYPKPGLIQVATATESYLIDPLSIHNFDLLARFLASTTLKVVHSMSEDLEVFRLLTGVQPQNFFDTQIAASFLGFGHAMGYQRLVESMLDISLEKGETRSDWLKRPLTQDQIRYAVQDVHYLAKIYPLISQQLNDKGWFESAIEESALMVDGSNTLSFDDYYLKIRAGWELSQTRQRVLKALAVWREKEIRRINSPRNRFLDDGLLLKLASALPRNKSALLDIQGLRKSLVANHGHVIIRIIQEQLASKASFEHIRRPLGGIRLDLYRGFRKEARSIAESRQIAPEVLAKKRILEVIADESISARRLVLPDEMGIWRKKLLKDVFTSTLSKFVNCHEETDLLDL